LPIYVTVAGDQKSGDPDQVRAKLEARYDKELATYSIDVAYVPGEGYLVTNAVKRTPLDDVRTDRTGPFKMPPAEDVTEEVRSFLRSEGVQVHS
jgi:hypothetical protein